VGVLVALVAFGVERAIALVLSSGALTVTRITLQGHDRVSREEMLARLEGLLGQSLLRTDLEGWRRALLDSPWVADAEIRRTFPGTLTVIIRERQPMGIARIQEGLFLVDGTGAVIDAFGVEYGGLDLPIIDGFTGRDEDSGADQTRAALAGRLLRDLARRPALAAQVSQIDVSDVRNAVLVLEDDAALVSIGAERFAERLQAYFDLRPVVQEQAPGANYVDLRYDDRVFVGPPRRNGS
jgi:cell division protein FtsQ